MTVACAISDDAIGVALRLSAYLDCQGRALGENGFQAVAGGVAGSLLTGLITIFVALIGYRLILGHVPSLRDGVTWMVRLGLVLALATSWPGFQTLIYRVAVDGPDELAHVLLPATGLTVGNANGRIQAAYDALRLGTEIEPSRASPPANGADVAAAAAGTPIGVQPPPARTRSAQPPLPQTASLLVVFTAGVAGALRVAIGLLLALGPLVVMGLLFDATLGLVTGWLRALAGAALALLAATIVTALELTVLDGELARLQSLGGGDFATFDPQALSTIVLLFAVVMLVATIIASRVGGSLRLSVGATLTPVTVDRQSTPSLSVGSIGRIATSTRPAEPTAARPPRAAAVADAVAGMARRRHDAGGTEGSGGDWSAPSRVAPLAAARQEDVRSVTPLGIVGRRSQPRPSRTATLRDRAS